MNSTEKRSIFSVSLRVISWFLFLYWGFFLCAGFLLFRRRLGRLFWRDLVEAGDLHEFGAGRFGVFRHVLFPRGAQFAGFCGADAAIGFERRAAADEIPYGRLRVSFEPAHVLLRSCGRWRRR